MKKTGDSVDAQNHTILVVDDNPANLSVVTDYLAGHGFQIMVAREGEAGLSLAQQDRPDLILLDVRLPGIDGFETCRRLKADERTREIPVIFMTIMTRVEDKVKGFEVGGVDYITKPFQREEVLARVTTHLTLSQLRQELQAVNAGLEQQVAARTTELRAANAQLEIELAERKRAEEALRRSETLLNATQRLAKIGGWDWDVERQTTFWTEETYRIHGFEPQASVPGTSDYIDRSLTCYDPNDRPIISAAFQRCAQQGDGYDLEFPFTSADGCRKWIRTTAAAVREDGRIIKVVGTLMDITERKQAEEEIRRLNQELEQRVLDRTAQLEATNKELEAFAYSISHDLRAPLRHIDGFLELLQRRIVGVLDEHSQHYMTSIADSARRMGALIDDLLSFSRMGRYELSKRPVDLDALVQEIIREFEPEIQGRTIRWRIADLPTVTGDRSMLHIALVNLISNALKFTQGRPQVDIEIGCQAGEKETVVFIRDNGVGFDMAYADKLFGVFQRLHHADEFEGTGIGLANVRRIITRHGGRVWAEGQVNQGATFYFSLPQTIQGG